MIKKACVILFVCLIYLQLSAAGAINNSIADTAQLHSHLRISLLTYKPGALIWEKFGHTCIRVIDSSKHDDSRDLVYNFGTFDVPDKDAEIGLVTGEVLYYLSVMPFDFFEHRAIDPQQEGDEQLLLLDDSQKTAILTALKKNALFINKFYHYQFFEDNCSTRIRDLFISVFGGAFVFGNVLPANSKLTFREITNQYLDGDNWYRVGGNLLLGCSADKVMTNQDAMFLPDYLEAGVAGATLNGQRFSSTPVIINKGIPLSSDSINGPFIFTLILALLTGIGLSSQKFRALGKVMSILMMVLSGILGCIIVFMWLGTEHLAFSNNFNFLWALPANLAAPFLSRRAKGKYAIAAIILLGVSLLLDVFKIQTLPLFELMPAFFALLCVYGMYYRNSKLPL